MLIKDKDKDKEINVLIKLKDREINVWIIKVNLIFRLIFKINEK